jgi:hypothetical protein
MNVEIGAEATQFPYKKYINGIAVAVQSLSFERDSIVPSAVKSSFKTGLQIFLSWGQSL